MSSTERLLNKTSISKQIERNLKPKIEEYWPETFTYSIDWENNNVVLSVTDAENIPVRNEIYSFEQLGVSDETLVDYWIYRLNLKHIGPGTAIRVYNDKVNQLNQYNAITVTANIEQISFVTLLAKEPIYTRLLTAREVYINNITIEKMYTIDEAKEYINSNSGESGNGNNIDGKDIVLNINQPNVSVNCNCSHHR